MKKASQILALDERIMGCGPNCYFLVVMEL